MHNKIKKREVVAKIVAGEKASGKKIGFTSGTFDVIHAGHAHSLNEAKKHCDILVVAINSDKSVKEYKGEDRPIIPEKERAMMIAAMEAADYVYLFDERRNKDNIEIIKPDLYIKSGDYDKQKMTSAKFVEQIGGKVKIVPFYKEISTSEVMKKIVKAYGEKDAEDQIYSGEPLVRKHGPVAFIDRDGTINEDIGYLHEPHKFKFLPNALEGLKRLQDMDLRLAIVTNQPGIGNGYYEKEDFFKVNQAMFRGLGAKKILIEKIYYCPHSAGDKCSCRKPNIGMFEKAKEQMRNNMEHSFMIGDSEVDIAAGKAAGCTTILIGNNEVKTKPDYKAKDLLDAAHIIAEHQRKHDYT
jgi:rfaE bifunctional protein nucleotidyltransferase chain/domain